MARTIYDWAEIQRFHDEGHGFVACQRRFGFTHTAWIKALRRGELDTGQGRFADRRRKYDWAEVQRYYDEGHSYRECRQRFGFQAMAWQKARLRGEIRSRPARWPLERVLARARCRHTVKRHLLQAGILKNVCDECGLSEWRGKAISIQLDHVNGIRNDNRLENLRMLCPNCHSQTETFGARNKIKLAEKSA